MVSYVWKTVKYWILTPFSHRWWPRLKWILYGCKFRDFSQLQVYTTCYKSLVKLLLAQLNWEKVCYSTIITGFYTDKMASCCLGVQGEGKAEVEHTQSSSVVTS